ncbi:MAG: 6-phosphofructokinase [Planctomycetaceae bacterium]|nr:6-phosphofructokinase [Planctomycetaceae bacterium]
MPTPLSSPTKPNTDLKRVAILFSGGPAPAANSVIASAAMCFSRAGIEVLGMKNGYTHLVSYKPGQKLEEGKAFTILDHKNLEGLRTAQGIMIGTARANPGKPLKKPEDFKNAEKTAQMQAVYDALQSLGAGALISIGGDDTLTTAAKFKLFQDTLPKGKPRVRVVHLPKTIDNDYKGIDFTFGYFTAVEMLAVQTRNLRADSQAAGAWFICQLMGRAAGWLTYGAAIGGEASLAIGMEDIDQSWWGTEPTVEPATGEQMKGEDGKVVMRKIFDVRKLVDRITSLIIAREAEGKGYGVVLMAEGLAEFLPLDEIHKTLSEDEYHSLKPDSFGHFPVSQLKYSGRLGRLVSAEYKKRTGKEKKVNGLQFGYEVRCHTPTAFDVVLGSQLGVGAYRALAEKGMDGVMVSVSGQLGLVFPKFEELINFDILRAHPRPIEPGEDFHQLARYLETWVSE